MTLYRIVHGIEGRPMPQKKGLALLYVAFLYSNSNVNERVRTFLSNFSTVFDKVTNLTIYFLLKTCK